MLRTFPTIFHPRRPIHLAWALLLFFGTVHASAQIDDRSRRPASAGRVVETFRFDDQDWPLPVPEFWIRAQSDPAVPRDRPGFPMWNLARLEFNPAADATSTPAPGPDGEPAADPQPNGTVRLDTAGGSASLRLLPGVVNIFPNADYAVTVRVRTAGLENAAACIEAVLLDQDGNPVPGAAFRSRFVREQSWTRVDLFVPGDFPAAAFLQLELLVLQPDAFESAPGEAQSVPRRPNSQRLDIRRTDVEGTAWFDDVIVVQVPRVELEPILPGGVFADPARPTIRLSVRDSAGEDVSYTAECYDANYALIDRLTGAVEGGRAVATWSPAIRQYGWYRISLQVFDSRGRQIGGQSINVIYGPPDPPRERVGHRAFGLIATHLQPPLARILPDIAARSGTGWVEVPAWGGRQAAPVDAGQAGELLGNTLEDLRRARLDPVVSLTEAPIQFRDALADPSDILRGLASSRGAIGPTLELLLAEHGQRVGRWRLNATGADTLFSDPAIADELEGLRSWFARLVPTPDLEMPWRTDLPSPAALLARGVSVQALHTGSAESLEVLGRSWGLGTYGTPGDIERFAAANLSLAWPTSTGSGFPRADAAELVRAAVLVWGSFGPHASRVSSHARFAIIDPWRPVGSSEKTYAPTVHLAAWRTVIDQLAGREVAAEVDLARGVRAFVLRPIDGGGYGAIVLWRSNPDAQRDQIELFLGHGDVNAVDIFGNRTPVPRQTDSTQTRYKHALPISDEPIFLENIDTELVLLLASVRLDPPIVFAQNRVHEHDIVIDNPWAAPLRGSVSVLEPGGLTSGQQSRDRSWQIVPRVQDFAAAPTQQARLPLELEFTPAEPAGRKRLVLDLNLGVIEGRNYGTVRVERPFEIQLPNVRMSLNYRVDDTGAVIVEATLVNTGQEPVSLDLTAFAPNAPSRKASVNELVPGQPEVRGFAFEATAEDLRDQQVWVVMTLRSGEGRLNQAVTIR